METFEEKDGDLNNSDEWKTRPRVHLSSSISSELWALAKKNNIKWSEALEFGIQFLFAQKDDIDYPDNKLSQRIELLMKKFQKKCEECEELRDLLERNKETFEEQITEEADQLLDFKNEEGDKKEDGTKQE